MLGRLFISCLYFRYLCPIFSDFQRFSFDIEAKQCKFYALMFDDEVKSTRCAEAFTLKFYGLTCRLVEVLSIAECVKGSILQYF